MEAQFSGIAELSHIPPTVVVIDVFRAFTTAAWAFAQGADRIILAESLEDARTLKVRHPHWITLKDGPPAPGFDLVNSPALLQSTDLSGRSLVQKTTNGTVGALAARTAPLLLCASFAVATATARVLRAHHADDVTFLVTGDDGRAEEDLACAQYIARLVADTATSPDGYLQRAAASPAAADLADGLRRGYRGIHPDDVSLCLEADRFPFAMAATLEDARVTLRPLTPPRTTGEITRTTSTEDGSS